MEFLISNEIFKNLSILNIFLWDLDLIFDFYNNKTIKIKKKKIYTSNHILFN